MATDQYQVAAQANRTRTVAVEAPRGRILDRNGKVLVDNRISVQVTIDRSRPRRSSRRRRAHRRARPRWPMRWPAPASPQTVEQLEDRVADQRYSPYVPVPVAGDVPEELKIWIDEHADELPSVAADRVAVRAATTTAAWPPTCSGTRARSPRRSSTPKAESPPSRTRSTTRSGSTGVERSTRTISAARRASRSLEVDAEGNPIRVIPRARPPVPGDDVVLNIDIDVQATAEQALQIGLDRSPKRPAVG